MYGAYFQDGHELLESQPCRRVLFEDEADARPVGPGADFLPLVVPLLACLFYGVIRMRKDIRMSA